ncbi:MAG: amidohydrolase [Desulfuromonadales bacterium]|nr:amidohydrolase [Desulfuromonadales bacterium]
MLAILVAIAGFGNHQQAVAKDAADIIFVNANVITMNEDQPGAKAIAIKDGKILAVGSQRHVKKHKGDETVMRDLEGQTVTPGFIDGHGHMGMVGMFGMAANLLPPPDGKVTSIAELQQTLKTWMSTSEIPEKNGIVFGTGYDDSQLKEKRHPTRDELDAVTTDYPVIVLHQSGHLSAVNSKALETLGITASTPNPPGGVIRRKQGSNEPNGVLEENANFEAAGKLILAHFGPEQGLETIVRGQETYASFGYTTAQDGGTTPSLAKGYIAAAEQGKLKLDVVSYLKAQTIASDPTIMQGPYQGQDYKDHYRIGGIKLWLDGSPQGKTAWLTEPFFQPPTGKEPPYRGYQTMTNADVEKYIEEAYRNDWQVLAHVNGDAAIDQYLNSIEMVGTRISAKGRRTVAVHAQVSREDQLDRMKRLEVMPSFYAAHAFYWGDWHRNSVLGPQRAKRISPTRSALDRGMKFTTHADSPVIPPNALRIYWATVNRVTRSGLVLGADQRVDPETVLKALTIWAAWQYSEEDRKGSIEPGKLADLVILDNDPLTVDPMTIQDIKVLETIKEGNSVYKAK